MDFDWRGPGRYFVATSKCNKEGYHIWEHVLFLREEDFKPRCDFSIWLFGKAMDKCQYIEHEWDSEYEFDPKKSVRKARSRKFKN